MGYTPYSPHYSETFAFYPDLLAPPEFNHVAMIYLLIRVGPTEPYQVLTHTRNIADLAILLWISFPILRFRCFRVILCAGEVDLSIVHRARAQTIPCALPISPPP